MQTRLIIGSIVFAAAFVLVPNVGAIDSKSTIGLPGALPSELSCDNGVTDISFPDPLNPGLTESISILCVGNTALDGHYGTDCTADSYSFWIGPQSKTWAYRFATSNNDGLSSSAVSSAWNSANTVWDGQVTKSLYSGYTLGGSGSGVGVGDGINQVGFKSFGTGGTIAAQYAWSSGGKIVETDGGYNTDLTFSTNGAAGTFDLQGVAAQEFGHGYGLGHSSTSSSNSCLTMYPYGNTGDTTKRTLGSGDIAAIKARYP